MFEIFRQAMERDAAIKVRERISEAQYFREINIAHCIFSVLVGAFSFLLLLISCYLVNYYDKKSLLILTVGIIVVILLVISSEILKRQGSFLNFIIKLKASIQSYFTISRSKDFFYIYFWLTLLLIYLPFCLVILISCFFYSAWINLSPGADPAIIDSLKLLIPFNAVIIAGQIALFTFVFGQLLGKYSSKIAGAIIRHRVIKLLWIYPILSLVATYIFLFYGYPIVLKNILVPLLFLLNIFCLVITLAVANTGTQTDKAIIYAGIFFSKLIRRTLKPSVVSPDARPSRFWRLLSSLGLDWRDPERMSLFTPPSKGTEITISSLRSLFNAANKAIEENQQEILLANLTAILEISITYTIIRASYYGSEDDVYSFLNNQIAPLIKVASKSTNEYMISDLTRVAGALGVLSLGIANTPTNIKSTDEVRLTPKSHSLSGLWVGLLEETFKLCFTMMRSYAPSEVIQQLQRIALVAYSKEYFGVVTISYLPAIKNIHTTCLTMPDFYRLILAGNCLRKTMKVWAVSAIKPDRFGDIHHVNQQIAETISELAVNQFLVEKLPSFNFSDATTVLLSKVDVNEYIIQDIFVFTLYRNFTEKWHQRVTIEDLSRIIELIVNLNKSAIASKISSAKEFAEALYEIGYFIIRSLPYQYTIIKDQIEQELKTDIDEFMEMEKTWQEILEEKLFAAWSEMFIAYFKSSQYPGLDWDHPFFGILGMGMVTYKERKCPSMKEKLVKSTEQYYRLVLQENADPERRIYEGAWDYLQLLGAWVRYFLQEEDLAIQIAKSVAEGRPFRDGFYGSSSSGRYGYLGYPGIMHDDFFLPWLRNLQPQGYLNEEDWEKFRSWQNELMCDDVLLPFYALIDETREPLRKKFYESLRKRKEQKEEGER